MGKSKYVITINRQFGSLGRPIAKRLAEKLGIGYYDRDLIDKAAKALDLPASVIDEEEEKAEGHVSVPFRTMLYPLGKGTSDMQDKIFHAQENLIRFLSENETCVIVGRCSDFVLLDRENSMHIYIYAPYQDRLKNSIEALKLSKDAAKKMIRDVDAARDNYQMHYAGYHPYDIRYKDILVNSSLYGVEGTADFLADAVKRRFGE
ncbi:MAG: cytidylate kinase-like family protein [Eubacteriales bacterium]|jgi:cytidylate kinase|nr:cytidylate kinase-like family protein [Lachnospiraceae bacterium]MDD5860333.1 cytidylate kinase-like family protein [Eubacteriales bacterium]MCH4063887.1 cytidylate kinase-like family protein [Lachnospiraceae bacterium]MCH4103391.1 cytidylate kinase-like family protein [Lachnospiraceae bacterium]MCI1309340.1 cytidylate kinase-like family protein [Lachnospiraceae bacterium]